MRIPFSKWSPCGNITLFLEQPLSPALHVKACAEVLNPAHLAAEQSGTVDLSTSPPRLVMMGGEFCVNATRAFASLLADRGYLPATAPRYWEGQVTVFGVPSPIRVRVSQSGSAHFLSAACLPLDPLPDITMLGEGLTLINLPGIVHLVLDTRFHPLPHGGSKAILQAAALWRDRYMLDEADASGVIWLEHSKDSPEHLAITPVVRVKATNSVFLETSCGSGSLAAVLSQGISPRHWHVRQPGGDELAIILEQTRDMPAETLAACAVQPVWQVWVEGTVKLIAEGVAYLECDAAIPA